MRKSQCCCVLVPVALLLAGLAAGGFLLFFRFTVQEQVNGHRPGDRAYVFGTVQDTVQVPLVATAYLVSDGKDSVWVATSQPLPRSGRHVLVSGRIKGGLKIPGKLGGGALLTHLEEVDRWDLPM